MTPLASTVIFWTLLALTAFAAALAIQMRVMISIVFRKALRAAYVGRSDLDYMESVAAAGRSNKKGDEMTAHLESTYPKAISHFNIARRWCMIGPALVLMVLVYGRFGAGVF